MAWLIDTNIAIELVNREPGVIDRVAHLPERPLLSVVTQVELSNGQARRRGDPQLAARVITLVQTLEVLSFTADTAEAYDRIISVTGFVRSRTLDRMIAAQAITRRATLVTMNGDDFADIPGLTLEIWPPAPVSAQ